MPPKYENTRDYRTSWYSLSTNRLLVTQGTLKDEIICDVCIVGGGMAGVSAALELSRKGFSVVLIEEQELAVAASGRNSGILRRGFHLSPAELAARFGEGEAKLMCNMTLEGIAMILQRIMQHEIKCDLKFGLLTAASKPRHVKALKQERAAWEKIGHTDLEYMPPERVRKMVNASGFTGGLFDPKGAHFHPLNYTLGIAQAAQKLGCRIYDYTSATKVLSEPAPKVVTSRGSVSARYIILAGSVSLTGTNDDFRGKIIPSVSYIAATEPMDAGRARALIPSEIAVAEARHAPCFYRVTSDGRMLVGGSVALKDRPGTRVDQYLRKRMLATFPALRTTRIDCCWTAPMEHTMNRLPHVGRLAPQIFFAHGFSGHGIITANIIGKLLAETVGGTAERFDVFARIQHKPVVGGPVTKPLLFTLGLFWDRLRDIL